MSVAADPSPGVVGVRRAADDVLDSLGLDRILGLTDHPNLGNGPDAVRQELGRSGVDRQSESMPNRAAGLLHAG